jgi:hypothetical protein
MHEDAVADVGAFRVQAPENAQRPVVAIVDERTFFVPAISERQSAVPTHPAG